MNPENPFLSKSKSYIAEALRLGGKQMLCDIIKWTIIIIIVAIVFLIVHHILCVEDAAIAASRSMVR
jgi:thiosulfate reductase cytochrome b subunit